MIIFENSQTFYIGWWKNDKQHGKGRWTDFKETYEGDYDHG
jgi:hypothetical protein